MEKCLPPKWNIIFLIYAEIVDAATAAAEAAVEGDAYEDMAVDLRELNSTILRLKTSDNFNLFTVRNLVKIKKNKIVSDETTISLLVSDSKNSGNKKKNRLKQLDKSANDSFLQKSIDIQRVFQFIDKEYPTSKTLLITFDHGSAFGIFKKVLRDPNKNEQTDHLLKATFFDILKVDTESTGDDLAIIRNKKFERQNGFYDSMQIPEEDITEAPTFDILSNDNLAGAIKNGFKNKCVEVLIMFNCEMQNMHACYAFKDNVKYLIAPQNSFTSPGYDYTAIANLIGNSLNLPVDGGMVAVTAINTIRQNFAKARKEATLEKFALFAVCLENYDEKIISIMRLFVNQISKMMRKDDFVRWNIQIVRRKCFTVGNVSSGVSYYMIDFNNFLINLNRSIVGSTVLLNLREQLKAAYDSIIVARLVGSNYYYERGNSWEKTTNTPPKGVMVYFPPMSLNSSDEVFRNFASPNSPYYSSLFDGIKWTDFLKVLYENSGV